MSLGWFVTGTDTGVGKTTVSCLLLQTLFHHSGLRTLGMKPVVTGAVSLKALSRQERASHAALLDHWPEWAPTDGSHDVYPDVLHLLASSSLLRGAHPPEFPPSSINPYRFVPAIAPHLAAQAAGVTLEFPVIAQALAQLQQAAEVVVAEGAGGFRVPLGTAGEIADLCGYLKLPLILVVGLRLGCINHALLTMEAIQARGLEVAGWVGNLLDPAQEALEQNLHTLKERLAAPCLGVVPALTSAQRSALYAGAAEQVLLQPKGKDRLVPQTLLDVLDVQTVLSGARKGVDRAGTGGLSPQHLSMSLAQD